MKRALREIGAVLWEFPIRPALILFVAMLAVGVLVGTAELVACIVGSIT